MATKGVGFVIPFKIIVLSTGDAAGDESANLTPFLIKDGVRAAATNAVGYTAEGWHTLAVTNAEANCDTLALDAVCSTLDRFVQPVSYDLVASAAGTGDTACTVTVTDGTDPLPGISVTIRNSGDTATVAGPLVTNTNGQIVFNLTNATAYRAVPRSSAGYSGGTTAFTMSGATAVTCAMTAATLPAAAPGGYCTVYVAVETQEGVVPTGKFWITSKKSPASRVSGAVTAQVVYGKDEDDVDATTGQASLQLLREAVVSLKLRTEDDSREWTDVVVADEAGPVNVEDLLPEA